jgi:MFS transporter, ACS family, glucarate transporter
MKDVTVVKSDTRAKVPFLALTRKFSPVTAVTFTYGWAYWVFVSWLPLYFFNYHHTDLKSSALLASVPFLAGVVGNTVGGSVSDYLLKRTGDIKTARCTVVSVSLAVCALLLLPIMFLSELVHIVPLLAASMLFLELTPAPMYAVTMDISEDFSGLGASFLIAGVAIAGIISPVVFGWLVDLTKNWNVPFATSIGILLMGALIVTLWHVETEAPSQVLEA